MVQDVLHPTVFKDFRAQCNVGIMYKLRGAQDALRTEEYPENLGVSPKAPESYLWPPGIWKQCYDRMPSISSLL